MAKQPAKGAKAPTKSRKTTATAEKQDESIRIAEVVDPIPPEVHANPSEEVEPAPVAEVARRADAAPASPAAADEKAPVAATPVPQQHKSSGGFFPTVLGGLVAGAIGYGIALLTGASTDADVADQLAAQSAAIADLRAEVAAIRPADLSSVEETQATLAGNIDRLQTEITGRIDALDLRIGELESLPVGDGTISDRAIAAYEADLQALRAEMAEMTGSARAQLDDARAEAAAIEENAAAAARAAAGRAALARIQTSLDNGEPLGAALGDLEAAIGGPAPDGLLAAQDGVPTLAALQDGFSVVASAALAAARSAGVAGEATSGFGAFLKNQFEVRSTTPQEGNSTDAILSRAEAALKAGRLSDTLAEIAALPEEARIEMTDWLGQAETRAGAITAVDILSTSLNDS